MKIPALLASFIILFSLFIFCAESLPAEVKPSSRKKVQKPHKPGPKPGNRRKNRRPDDPNDLLVVHTFQLGETDGVGDDDPTATEFWGHDAMNMIEFVRIQYQEDENYKYVRCVGFGYTDKECNCPEKPLPSTDIVVDFPFDREEYITEVRGDFFLSVSAIYFKTSKGKEIGPYGTETDIDKMDFKASYNGAPLLYVEGLKGLWLYNLNFSFHDKGVLELEGLADEVANRSYVSVKGKIEDIYEIRDDYQRMLPDVARKGCYLFEEDQHPNASIACDLQGLLDQVNILATGSLALRNHARRSLLELKDYDSAKYLEEVREAKDFHTMMTEIKFDLQTIIDVTDQQSAELNRYFTAIADADIAIAEQDWLYIQGAINSRMEGAEEAIQLIDSRLTMILGVGVSLAATEVIDRAFQLGTIIAANMNPFKWIFGGPDLDAIFDAIEKLLDAVKDLIRLATLLGRLDEFLGHSTYVVEKLLENMEQMVAMESVIEKLADETDPDVVADLADEYIKLYGEYTPQVTEADIMYATTLLSAIASESCSIVGEFTGSIGSIIGAIYEPAELDCQFVEADIAVLQSHFTDVYTLQFEAIDALTVIVKGTIAKVNAGRIGSIKNVIDLRTAAIGTAMVETKYQAASLARCDILEYVEAGKRPDICKKLLFRSDDIQKLIAYRGSAHKSDWYSHAKLPIGHDSEDVDVPFINITNLLRGEFQTIRLPSQNKAWLQKYGWLPSVYDEESVFYYIGKELYVPGIKCNETGEEVHTVNTRSVSVHPVDLYAAEAPPIYNADKQMTVFEYFEPTLGACPGFKQTFPLFDSETLEKIEDREVCVTSPGYVTPEPRDDFTYPSGFNTWTMRVMGHADCTLVVDDSLDYKPMATVRLIMRQVFVKKDPSDPGMDHCWPEGTRCEADEFCVNEPLSYRCQGSSMCSRVLKDIETLRMTIRKALS